MKIKNILSLMLVITVISCTEKEEDLPTTNEEILKKVLPVKLVQNIYAPHYDMDVYPAEKVITEEFVKFDFETGKIVEKSNDNWDIGFKGTKIIINGGTKTKPKNEPKRTRDVSLAIIEGLFDDIKKVPENITLKKDKKNILAIPTGSDNGWYHYDSQSHTIIAKPQKKILIKTRLGKYVKMEIISYYKDSDSNKAPCFYSFKYVINPKRGDKSLY